MSGSRKTPLHGGRRQRLVQLCRRSSSEIAILGNGQRGIVGGRGNRSIRIFKRNKRSILRRSRRRSRRRNQRFGLHIVTPVSARLFQGRGSSKRSGGKSGLSRSALGRIVVRRRKDN